MADFTTSRLGQVNGAGDAKALFLKKFGGEVLTQFWNKNVTMTRHRVKNLKSGKSYTFPVTGQGAYTSHTPGTEIQASTIPHNEKEIGIDDLLIAPRFIASIDEAMNHYDHRSIYSKDVGATLAMAFDRHVLQMMVLAARTVTPAVTGGNPGTVITSATAGTSGDALFDAIYDAAQALSEKNVSLDETWVYVRPAQYYNLVNAAKIVNRDYTAGSNGGVDVGRVATVAGLPIVMTNNLPITNITTDTPAAYNGNFSTTVAAIANREAVGTVKLIDLGVETEYSARHQGTFILGKMAVGHGILRPECAVEIKTA